MASLSGGEAIRQGGDTYPSSIYSDIAWPYLKTWKKIVQFQLALGSCMLFDV